MAAGKKDFSTINTGSRVNAAISSATGKQGQQGEASAEEKSARASALRTQGRKGCKAVRINMAFSPENYEFIRIMARVTGKTMTEFANLTIAKYREEHPELYEKAQDIINSL
jgi:hypothetical protein